jgi:hypothetical protein
LCISWINKKLYSIRMHGTTVGKKRLFHCFLLIEFLSREFLVTTELLYCQNFVVYFVFNYIKHAYVLRLKCKVINVTLNACPFCSFFRIFFNKIIKKKILSSRQYLYFRARDVILNFYFYSKFVTFPVVFRPLLWSRSTRH